MAATEKYHGKNTTYNVMDTLIELNPLMWNTLLQVFLEIRLNLNIQSIDVQQEAFIRNVETEYGLQRMSAYTYWDCIRFSQENNYRAMPIQPKRK